MKRRSFMKITALIAFMAGCSFGQRAMAAEGTDTFVAMPLRVISVKGDADKFRALNWMNDGTTGGIKEMTINRDLGKGGSLSFEGHAIPGDNDLGADLTLAKKDLGYLRLKYGNFRKYYPVYGGFYPNFTGTSSISKLDFSPKMDMGHFLIELGNGTEDDSGLVLSYELDSKDGTKNMLNWGSVVQTLTRKITPAWENIDEETHTIALKANTELAGFNVTGKQSVEFFNGRTYRDELTSTTQSLRQEEDPQATQLVSSLKADRWVVDDKAYVAAAYQYQHLRFNSLEVATERYIATGNEVSSSKSGVTDAQNSYDSHTWVQHLIFNPTANFNITTKLKEELISQEGDGNRVYGYGGSGATRTASESKIMRTAEAVSLRYSGIPKTSAYADLELQQTRAWLSQWDNTSSTKYFTESIEKSPAVTGTVGARFVPNSKVNMTSQLRHQDKHHNYNYLKTTDTGIQLGRYRNDTNEWSNRVAWKPFKWFENALRVQLIDNVFHTQSIEQYDSSWLKSQAQSRVYTYDIVLQPADQWMFDLAYSLDNSKISTPASQKLAGSTATGGIPTATINTYSWLFTTSFIPKDNLSLFSTFLYSRSKNYNWDIWGTTTSTAGIPYGIDSERYDMSLGLKWSPKKDLSIEPHYGYSSYRANESMDYGNYSAHITWLDVKWNW